jgi:hypothetical protein
MPNQPLTNVQQDFVWRHICSKMDADDRNPNEVIEDTFGGNRDHYLQVMADWHQIRFCFVCGRANKEAPDGFVEDLSGRGNNLCAVCARQIAA